MDKKQLRSSYKKRRQELSEEEVENYSKQIAASVLSNFSFTSYNNIHIFLPIESKKEVNTLRIIEQLRNKHPHLVILVPKIVEGEIKTFILQAETKLEVNEWGIAEPVDAEEYPSSKIDFIFIPLLAFDKRGHRIGYGRGFYDRFLNACNISVIKIGLSFFESEAKIQEDPHDVALDYCVTPGGIYTF